MRYHVLHVRPIKNCAWHQHNVNWCNLTRHRIRSQSTLVAIPSTTPICSQRNVHPVKLHRFSQLIRLVLRTKTVFGKKKKVNNLLFQQIQSGNPSARTIDMMGFILHSKKVSKKKHNKKMWNDGWNSVVNPNWKHTSTQRKKSTTAAATT